MDLSITLDNVGYLEDVGSYLCSKFETIGSEFMNKDIEIVFNHDMTNKPRYEHLKYLDLVKYHFYRKLDTEECTKIKLSIIHNGKIWMGEDVVEISFNLFHEVTNLSKQGETR